MLGIRGALVATFVGVALLAGCDEGDAAPPPLATETSVEVLASGFIFRPETVEVLAGTPVRWTNSDEILHTATAGTPDGPTGEFDGQMQGAGTSFSFRFDTPGRYAFFCSRHPHMRGEVVVR